MLSVILTVPLNLAPAGDNSFTRFNVGSTPLTVICVDVPAESVSLIIQAVDVRSLSVSACVKFTRVVISGEVANIVNVNEASCGP